MMEVEEEVEVETGMCTEGGIGKACEGLECAACEFVKMLLCGFNKVFLFSKIRGARVYVYMCSGRGC